jgi:chromatin assembly factor 1 subunit B
MRSKTLEIRWHDTSPIFSSDFQPLPPHQLKKLLNIPPSSSAASSSSSSLSSTAAGKEKEHIVAGGRSYRLATGGADNHVRVSTLSTYWEKGKASERRAEHDLPLSPPPLVPSCSSLVFFAQLQLWLIHPNIPEQPSSAAGPSSAQLPPVTPPPPRAEFLATLKRHTASVNVVRWSPKGEYLSVYIYTAVLTSFSLLRLQRNSLPRLEMVSPRSELSLAPFPD